MGSQPQEVASGEVQPGSTKAQKFWAWVARLLLSLSIFGLVADAFGMGRFFWAGLLIWLLAMRTLHRIRRGGDVAHLEYSD